MIYGAVLEDVLARLDVSKTANDTWGALPSMNLWREFEVLTVSEEEPVTVRCEALPCGG